MSNNDHSHAELIATANQYFGRRDYTELRRLLQSKPPRLLIRYPELGFMQVSALSRAGDQKRAGALASQLLKTRAGRANTSLHRRLLNAKAVASLEGGNGRLAADQWADLLQKATSAGDLRVASWACANIGIVKSLFCEWADAVSYFERARLAFEESGSVAELSAAYNNLGETYRQLQRYDLAIDNVDHAIEYGIIAGSTDDLVMCHLSKARIALDIGDLPAARRIAGRCFSEFIRLGSVGREAEALKTLGEIALKRSAIDEAEGYLIAALAIAERLGLALLQAECLERLAAVKDLTGDEEGRRASAQKAILTYQLIGAFARARKVLFEQ